MLTTLPVKIEKLDLTPFDLTSSNLFIKREDQSHPHFGGNKWRKLQFNLLKAQQMDQDTVLTFGGPWSNHIYSTAAACKDVGLKSIGVIRGERPTNPSTTLQFAEEQGMRLIFISRAEYREKEEPFFKAWLRDEYGPFYLIPEGGSNYLGVQGCCEILSADDARFKHIFVSMGTGATAAGLALSCRSDQTIHGIPAINQGEGLAAAVEGYLYGALMDADAVAETLERFRIHPGFQRGGFAKWDPELLEFMRLFHQTNRIQLDQVYTAKAMKAAISLMQREEIEGPGLFIHTGGLQGIHGLERELGASVFS